MATRHWLLANERKPFFFLGTEKYVVDVVLFLFCFLLLFSALVASLLVFGLVLFFVFCFSFLCLFSSLFFCFVLCFIFCVLFGGGINISENSQPNLILYATSRHFGC